MGYNLFDDEVIKHAIDLKSHIISSLEKNSSELDINKVNNIKWIENYIDEVHETLIEKKIKIPMLIKKHKNFVYTISK